MIAAMLWRAEDGASLSLERTVGIALASARQRVDAGTEAMPVGELMQLG